MTDDPGRDLSRLLTASASGDQDSFAALYDATAPRVLGLVLRVLRDRAQAEEVTQEVFLQVWRTAGSFDSSRGSALGWLLTLAHRRAVDRVRSVVAQSRRDVAYESQSVTTPFDSTAEIAEGRLEATEVHVALGALTATQRSAVELAFFDGLTHSEVSERLGVPLGTAKTRIRDGLRRMRNELGGAR
ncbi:ECF RNA polymerase sigma factor SigK [Ornithinimicrobium cryptoxanthini]|uniref:ECF RNA polymerase sigma factor SigK n=1 Tax=Ornithinimicrobium cryptoxanthini TaxID=2934161 RepID=A0ABY4YGK2_9MICO|nr:ECF RNA polymerase sigma factor SigK [Ornithinimicrobium cryptoxanthini]USQ75896.1 ECF RNA polymerase sigma factor SigK [Ornithinimicrobium cryptoxanthini]